MDYTMGDDAEVLSDLITTVAYASTVVDLSEREGFLGVCQRSSSLRLCASLG